MTGKCALRALKRKISDTIYARLVTDNRPTRQAGDKDPGGQSGNDSGSNATTHTPIHRLFGQATPGPTSSLEPNPARHPAPLRCALRNSGTAALDIKRPRYQGSWP